MSGRPNPIAGVLQLAVGRSAGLALIGDTPSAFLNSLAPLLAFPIAGALVELYRDNWLAALLLLLQTVVAQLTPPVVSEFLARRWSAADRWLHYATAYNWCYWALPMVGAILTFVLAVAVGAGLPSEAAVLVLLGGLGLYSLWLHWFVARHALGLGWLRAVILVIVVNAATVLLAIGPALLG